MQPFLALITPVGGGGPVDPGFGVPGWPAHPIAPGGPPPGIWPSPGHPAHPIAPGGQPPGIWGGAGGLPPWVMPPIAPGGQPPGIWGPTDPRPTNPIVIPPDAVSPGVPSHPIYLPPVISGGPGSLPPYPAHPIAPGGQPPGIWGGPGSLPPSMMPPIYVPPGNEAGGTPTHPIVLPPGSPPDTGGVLVHVWVPEASKAVWFLVQEPAKPVQPPTAGPKK
jgi:hypothetical protein